MAPALPSLQTALASVSMTFFSLDGPPGPFCEDCGDFDGDGLEFTCEVSADGFCPPPPLSTFLGADETVPLARPASSLSQPLVRHGGSTGTSDLYIGTKTPDIPASPSIPGGPIGPAGPATNPQSNSKFQDNGRDFDFPRIFTQL